MAPGAWLTKVAAHLDLNLPTRVSEELVTYWTPKDTPAAQAVDVTYKSMPTFIVWENNGLGPHGYYGLPQIEVPGVKASAHYCGHTTDPDARLPTHPRLAEVQESTRTLIDRLLPTLDTSRPSSSQKCLYTTTPDYDFVIGRHPALPSITLVGGGSGHGFKFGTAVGEMAACESLGERLPVDVPEGKFAAGRFTHLDPNFHEQPNQALPDKK